MTIRQHLKQRLWLAVMVGNGTLIGACLLFYATRPHALHENELVLMGILVVLLYFLPQFIIRRSIRCPNCTVRIGQRMSRLGDQPEQCPSCGIDLDEPMATRADSTESTGLNEVDDPTAFTRRVRLLQGKDDL